MPCDSNIRAGQSLADRNREISSALRRLEASLAAGRVRVTVGRTGAVAFAGWTDRDGVSDVCAYRALTAEGSAALRMAVARAEAMGGTRVNAGAVAAGVHSHDGGKSWHKGH